MSAVAGKTGTWTATYTGSRSLEGMSISTHTTAQCKLLSSWRMHNMQGALTTLQLFTLRACQRHRHFMTRNVMKLIGVNLKGIFIYQQDSEAALLWVYWSFSGNHHDRHCRSVWSQSRKTQRQNSSNGICTQGSLFHVWSTSAKNFMNI